MLVELYTDGACLGNPGFGGWGVLLRSAEVEKTFSGAEANTTNNRMELMAALQGLKRLRRPSHVKLVTDSQYLRLGMTAWVHNWQRQGWKKSDRKPVKNADLWQQLLLAAEPHQVQWHWVKAHSGHPDNERVDKLAYAAAAGLKDEQS